MAVVFGLILGVRVIYYGFTDQYSYSMYDKSGQVCLGNDKALNSIKGALAKLSSGKEGKALVDDLMASTTHSTQIVDRKGAANKADSQKGSFIIWDSQNTNGGPDQNGNTTRDYYIGLGHEMAHVQDIWNGTFNNGIWQSVTDANGNSVYATYKENQIRAENGLPLRVFYAIDAYNNNPDPSTRIIRAGTSESVYYQQNGATNYCPLLEGQVPYKY